MNDSAYIFDRYVQGDQNAADELFYRYIERLTRLARSRLSASLGQRVDAEDIVMSAYRSFFIGARDGEFAIEESGELWSLLVRITLNKLYRSAAHHDAQRRSISREAPLPEQLENVEPSATDAIALADALEVVMRSLSANRRRILELRLQGELIESIAGELGVSERTVRRALAAVRGKLVELAELPAEWIEQIPKTKPRILIETPERKVETTLRYSDFVLEKQVGIGGMGRVYQATRKSDGKTVAIKYLRKRFLKQTRAVERFAEEAATVAKLMHPNIVGVQGFGHTTGGGFFIQMDFVPGKDLAEVIRDVQPSLKQIVEWLLPICDALQHAHLQGVIHCDLKPSNILIREDGTPLLTDFGLAKRVGEGVSRSEFAGTAAFMAPEQITNGEIEVRTDVYGLGAVLFNLATGEPPFEGQRPADIMARVVAQKEPPRPSAIRSDAACFDELCAKCLCEIGSRFTMQELSAAIEKLKTKL